VIEFPFFIYRFVAPIFILFFHPNIYHHSSFLRDGIIKKGKDWIRGFLTAGDGEWICFFTKKIAPFVF